MGISSSKLMPSQPAATLLWAVCWLGVMVLLTAIILLALSPWDLTISLALTDFRGGHFGYFVQEWGRKPASFLIICAAVVLTTRSMRDAYPLGARASASLAVHMVLQPTLLTNAVKFLSGRQRPLHLGPRGEGFVAFYEINPGLGDFSFPSGHVAVAMILTPCVLLLWRTGRTLSALAVTLLTFGWAGTIAFGRVCYGAHFPTDVVFSIGIGVALAPLSLSISDHIFSMAVRSVGGGSFNQ